MTEENFNSRPGTGSLRLFLVRHGETEANLKRFIQGASNGLLNARGYQQVDRLARHLKNVALDRILASDLQRAMDTASVIALPHGLTVEVDERLREWNCGELDGRPAAMYLQMVKDTGKPLSLFEPPGGEKLAEVRKRAKAFLDDLVANHLGESILLCSHGDFMRMLVGVLLQIDIDAATAFHFDNASYSVFELTDNQWKVLALNRIATGCEQSAKLDI